MKLRESKWYVYGHVAVRARSQGTPWFCLMSEPELICTWTYILVAYREEELIHQVTGSDLGLTNLCESPEWAPSLWAVICMDLRNGCKGSHTPDHLAEKHTSSDYTQAGLSHPFFWNWIRFFKHSWLHLLHDANSYSCLCETRQCPHDLHMSVSSSAGCFRQSSHRS